MKNPNSRLLGLSRGYLLTLLTRWIYNLIKGLSLGIINKVDLQPYLFFDDVCHLAIKIKSTLRIGSPFTLMMKPNVRANRGREVRKPLQE